MKKVTSLQNARYLRDRKGQFGLDFSIMLVGEVFGDLALPKLVCM